MPRATNNILDTEHVDLTTCAGGFVELRRMTYGQWLKRQEIAMNLSMRAANGESGQPSRRGEMVADVAIAGLDVARFEFKHCIAAHNLEDDQGNALDFSAAFTIEMLDPRVGQEIGEAINKLNQFEGDLGN